MTERRRVLVPQALGSDEFLRVTWHEGRRLMVFSNWQGDKCVAATPVRVDDLGEVAEMVVGAFVQATADDPATWPAPLATDVIALDPARNVSDTLRAG